MPSEEKTPAWRHQISVIDREEMTVCGVVNLGSFDDNEITMETECGMLLIKGEQLNIKQLSLDKGNVSIEGSVKSIVYDDDLHKKKGLLERLLK